jgi:hypothetical protein
MHVFQRNYTGTMPQSIGPSTLVAHIVTKATQNEALLWKIAVFGMEKAPC